jgi:hypothetical protein
VLCKIVLENSFCFTKQVQGFLAKNNTTFQSKELTYGVFGKITKDVWTKAEEHVVKIEKEYC